MVKGFDPKGHVGVVVYTTLFIVIYFFLSYLYFYCLVFITSGDTSNASQALMPELRAVFLDLIAFIFVIIISELSNPVKNDDALNFSSASWTWMSLIILLSVLPSLVNKSMYSEFDGIKNNLIFCFLQYDTPTFESGYQLEIYNIVLRFLVFCCVIFSMRIAKKFYRYKIEGLADSGGKHYFWPWSVVSYVFFSSFSLSIYLIVSHTPSQQHACGKIDGNTAGYIAQFFIYFILMVGIVAYAAKRYASLVLCPWLQNFIEEGKMCFPQFILVATYVGIWLLILNKFLAGLNLYGSEVSGFRIFAESVKVVFEGISRHLSMIFYYADEIADVLLSFMSVILVVFQKSLLFLFEQLVAKPYFLLLLIPVIVYFRYKSIEKICTVFINLCKTIMIKIKEMMQSLWGGAKIGALIVGLVLPLAAVALYLMDWKVYVGQFDPKNETESKIRVPYIQRMTLQCRDNVLSLASQNYSEVEVNLDNCSVVMNNQRDSCQLDAIIAVSVFITEAESAQEIDYATRRGVNLVNVFLREYRAGCNNNDLEPNLFVLNLGQSLNIQYEYPIDKQLGIFVARYNTGGTSLNELLKSKVSDEGYLYWGLVNVNSKLYY